MVDKVHVFDNLSSTPHILVIDDEQVMREGCERILSKRGFRISLARDGREGLEALKSCRFDIMLLDLKMPGMSGMEVLREVASLKPRPLVIVITGYATIESAVEAMKIGAYDFVSKPFSPEQLTIVVERALEKRRLEEEAELLRREREKSLKDIAQEKSRIRTIVHCMAGGVVVADRENRIVLSNPAAARMLGIYDTELVGKPLSLFIKDEELNQLVSGILACTCPEDAVLTRELVIGNHPPVYLRAHACSVKSEEGEVLGSVIVLEDITHLKEMDRMKSNFVAMVSHELRAPLAAIQQQLMVLKDGLVGDINEKQQHLLERIKERTDGMMTMVRNLLDLSKIETGQIARQKEEVRIVEILKKVEELFRPQAAAKGISLRGEEAKELPLVSVDRSTIEVVFNNLVSNAILYTPAGGSVTITAGMEGRQLKVAVSDTGIGISQEDLPRVFDRFYRVRSEQTRQVVGAGLGLAVTKSIVEAHGGSIEVESELGKGTTFTVFLPLPEEE